jgi:AraC-like DNA-binding protein
MTQQKTTVPPKDLATLAREFIALCETNCADIVSVERCADRMAVSYQVLRRATLRVFDKAPLEILSEIRLRRMKQLLTTTDMSCRHVGLAVGLDCEVRASRFFKTQEGISMSAYRARHAIEREASAEMPHMGTRGFSPRVHTAIVDHGTERAGRLLQKRRPLDACTVTLDAPIAA